MLSATTKSPLLSSDLKNKLLYTIFILLIFRLGSHIPVPFMNPEALQKLLSIDGNSLFDFINTFSGGAFANATIFAMSITPYVNASIIMQLLTVGIPALERINKEDDGRQKINQYTRYLCVVIAFIQSSIIYMALQNVVTQRDWVSYLVISVSFTAGTAFLMWLGERITDKGIGNGISILIFAGIVSRAPQMISTIYKAGEAGNWIAVIAIIVLSIAAIGFVVMITEAERRIPVHYAQRMVGRKMYGGRNTHIPLKIAMSGVMPIIFAMSIISLPTTIIQLAKIDSSSTGIWAKILLFVSPNSWFYSVLYFLLIIFFTYFYTSIQFNTTEISNNMKKNGGFIPGIRPGRPTTEYLDKIVSRMTLAGALFLGIIAVLPILLGMLPSFRGISMNIGGTSLLIVVGVALETVKQIQGYMLVSNYKGFLDK